MEYSSQVCFPCRHWQELGYLILYITARPDMQQKKVVAWLAQHNFPHGMVAFMDGLSAEPLRQKANFLKNLVQDVRYHSKKYQLVSWMTCYIPHGVSEFRDSVADE